MPPIINYETCEACGTCVNICSEDVFFGTKGFGKGKGVKPVITYPDICWHCNNCVNECPTNSITLLIPLSMHIAYREKPF